MIEYKGFMKVFDIEYKENISVNAADTGTASSCGTSCSTGSCNKRNVYDWLSGITYSAERDAFNIVEVSFKKGSRKAYYRNVYHLNCITGDTVVVETPTGYDVGIISLSGELVRLQLRKRGIQENSDEVLRLLRIANERDLAIWEETQQRESETMLLARVIARDLGLEMKIGDVEFQGDGRKATFYYTADTRVDFRELIKLFARDFKVKIEMRQIGARQEASRIGGIGTCGRELCCSSWITDFKTVSTNAARYQNLSINQIKLSGQCGRLKCCLNYELDTYMDALKDFPKDAEILRTQKGDARLMKTDIFKRKMWYFYADEPFVELTVEHASYIKNLNIRGIIPEQLFDENNKNLKAEAALSKEKVDFADVVGQASLRSLDKSDKRAKRKAKKERQKQQPPLSADSTAAAPKMPLPPKQQQPDNNNNPNTKPPQQQQQQQQNNRGNQQRHNQNNNNNNPNRQHRPDNNNNEAAKDGQKRPQQQQQRPQQPPHKNHQKQRPPHNDANNTKTPPADNPPPQT